jgi:putative membrane protein
MTATQSDLAGLSRFIFRAPSWYTSLAFAVLIAAMAGVAAFDSGESMRTWRGLFFLGKDAWEGIFFIGVPTVVAAFGTSGVDRFVGGTLTPNRSSLLALVCEVLIVAIVTLAAIVSVFTGLGQRFVFDALVVALASVFAFRLLVVMAVSRSSLLVAAIPASIQTLAAAVLLFIYSGTLTFMSVGGPILDAYLIPYLARADHAPSELSTVSPDHFVLLGLTCAVYAFGVYVFIVVVDRPWRRSLGVSVLDFLRGFVGHIAEGTDELEEFFEQLGEKAIVPVTVLAFRSSVGEKARFILPMIHPGPMGEIGGGNFPERVATRSDGLAFPPHATAGHDFNLVTEREVDTILEAADAAYDRIEYGSEATQSVQVQSGEAKMLGQAFGDDALLVSTYAPEFADDVEYAVGLSAAAEARTAGLDDVLLVDAHNSNNGLDGPDLGHVTPGSKRSFDMITAAGLAGEHLSAAARGDLSMGVAWDRTEWEPTDGIGPLGIRVAVTEVVGQRTAYVLVDGNNMEPGLRDAIVADLTEGEESLVDVAEAMTTDTHIVNTVEADNQVGAVIDQGELRRLVADLTREAVRDVEPVEAGMAVERTEVTVFGNDRTETLASHANAVVAMGGAFAVSIILAAMAVSVLIFLFA